MNLTKGIDRIAVLIAILLLLPGYLEGFKYFRYKAKTLHPDYVQYLERGFHPTDPTLAVLTDGNSYVAFRNIYQYPPSWKSHVAGFVSAPLTFFLVLFGIRFSVRLTRRLTSWLIGGFKAPPTD